MSRPYPPRQPSGPFVRINGKIRAREVRVIGPDGKQLGILSLGDALNLARANGVDLVEIAPNATPPVCRVVDYGKFRYEQAKRDKESKKHQHANKVKEVQLSAKIDPHDLGVKIQHAVDFLCDDMKVKITLKFRGREMAHTEIGFQIIHKFLAAIGPYGQADFPPKLIGRGVNVMISPLPRAKRAKNPRADAPRTTVHEEDEDEADDESDHDQKPVSVQRGEGKPESGAFANNPFAQLNPGQQ